MNLFKSITSLFLNEIFNPGIQDVYLNDSPLKPSQERADNGLDGVVYNTIEDFQPPFGEITMGSGHQNVPNRSGKYTHDYTITVGAEGWKPEVVITPPTGSVLEYEVGEVTPTADPLVWNARVSVKSPPDQEVTEEPVVNFYAVPVGTEENQTQPTNFSLGKIMTTGYGTDILYNLKQPTDVKAVVYDMMGRHVETLSDGKQLGGENKLHWDSYDDAAGTYIIAIQAGKEAQSIKVMKR